MTIKTKAQVEAEIIQQWIAQPRVQAVLIITPDNLERLYGTLKNRFVGDKRVGTTRVVAGPEVRDVTFQHLDEILAYFVSREEWSVVKKPAERIAREEKERRDRAIAIEQERLKNDPAEQAKRNAESDRAAAEAKAIADAADKAYWTERAQKQPGENSLQCLQRYRRERVAAGKEAESSFAHSGFLTPVVSDGITVHNPETGTRIVPVPASEPGTPDSGSWNVNDAFVTTAKARNRS
jgi:hypothetical protein